MTRGVRLYLVGSFVLVSLAGCGRGFFQSAEREPWRAEAEVACLKSGAVKESPELVRIDPISGPGVCGAEFPLKVAALGEGNGSFGFADDLRPPGIIGNQPRWPVRSRPAPPPSQTRYPNTIRQRAAPAELRRAVQRADFADRAGRRPAGRRNRSAGRRHAGLRAGGAAYRGCAGLSAARALSAPSTPRPIRRIRRSAAAAARSGAGRSRRRGRAGRDQADGDAGLSDRLGARPLARRFRAAGGACAGSARASSRSSRSPPIPAAA